MNGEMPMKCQECQEQISQLLDNEFSTELLQPLFLHLSSCEECRKFFVHTTAIHNDIKKLDYALVPEKLDQKFAVLKMKEPDHSIMTQKIIVTVPSAMLSGLLVFMISFLFLFFMNTIQTTLQTDVQKSEAEYFKPNTLQMPYYN